MTKYTYKLGYRAHTPTGEQVMLPDQVAENQPEYDGKTIVVLYRGQKHRAVLRGDLYGLHTAGTGDPVVCLGGRRRAD